MITVNPGTQSFSEIKFEGEGFEILDENEKEEKLKDSLFKFNKDAKVKGDFIVKLKVKIPSYNDISNKDREVLGNILENCKL